MNSAALFGWWGLFTWIPSYLALPIASGGRGLVPRRLFRLDYRHAGGHVAWVCDFRVY